METKAPTRQKLLYDLETFRRVIDDGMSETFWGPEDVADWLETQCVAAWGLYDQVYERCKEEIGKLPYGDPRLRLFVELDSRLEAVDFYIQALRQAPNDTRPPWPLVYEDAKAWLYSFGNEATAFLLGERKDS